MTPEARGEVLSRYVAGAISAEQAADELGPYVSVSEVILEARDRLGQLPDRDDAFTRAEFTRGLELLRLESSTEAREVLGPSG